MLICFRIHNFPSGGSVVTWFNRNFKFLNQHGDHQEILYVFFEPLPIFYEPLCSVCLAGWHKARDPGLPKDFLLGFVLALCCCCSQKTKSFLKEHSFSKLCFHKIFWKIRNANTYIKIEDRSRKNLGPWKLECSFRNNFTQFCCCW